MHVHVYCERGEAKFWLEPRIELAQNYEIPARDLRVIEGLIEDHVNEIRKAWKKHFDR